jgi:putative transposase
MMAATQQLVATVGLAPVCQALGLPRATLYRTRRKEQQPAAPRPRPIPDRALSPGERQHVLDVLHSVPFRDDPPAQVYAKLLDQGRYLCSTRTMYRILHAVGEVKERRNQLVHPTYVKPELLATGPNQVWSWDITKLKGPVKWSYFYLYVILDIFSRYVVGWMVVDRESSTLARRLIAATCVKQGITPDQLTIHADRGSSMKSHGVAMLLSDLGVTKTHSRPHVSNDNPFSESHFKTLKYRPEFPARFGSLQDARAFCRGFFPWYNTQHHHSGIGLLTPEAVHYGRAERLTQVRQAVLDQAHDQHPERFVNKRPQPPQLPTAVWINPPDKKGDFNHALALCAPNLKPQHHDSREQPLLSNFQTELSQNG